VINAIYGLIKKIIEIIPVVQIAEIVLDKIYERRI
jgi:hypothetical protein